MRVCRLTTKSNVSQGDYETMKIDKKVGRSDTVTAAQQHLYRCSSDIKGRHPCTSLMVLHLEVITNVARHDYAQKIFVSIHSCDPADNCFLGRESRLHTQRTRVLKLSRYYMTFLSSWYAKRISWRIAAHCSIATRCALTIELRDYPMFRDCNIARVRISITV